ncbi:MAG TPA: protein kinase [Myxococcales bacterium]|jgi:serine/threonine-protein kinase
MSPPDDPSRQQQPIPLTDELPDPRALVGQTIDNRYRVDAWIATGGMGSVYRAEQVFIRRPVALKVLHPFFQASAEVVERFRREAQITFQLRSAHVVEVIDFGRTADGCFYLAMELLEGESLQAFLQRKGRLSPPEAVPLLRQLLETLSAAHAGGIAHRDLKPENLWLVPRPGEPEPLLKILDFGIAKLAEAPKDAPLTRLGFVMGTPEYLAPEQACGLAADTRADLYSVGLITFVMLAGRHPFDTRDVRALVQAQAVTPVPGLAEVAPDLGAYPRLCELVKRACEKDVAARAQTAAELLSLLEGAEAPAAAAPQPSPGPVAPSPAPSQPLALAPLPPSRPSIPPRATLSGGPATANLSIMFTGIVGFEEKTSKQTLEQNAQMLAEHDRLVMPVLRAFKGQKIKSVNDALLLTFRSPTDSVLCGLALQDRLAQANEGKSGLDRLDLKVAINMGEVRLERGDVFGEPVNIAARVASEAQVGEVWFTDSVHLAMNKAGVPIEEIGARTLKGIPEPVKLFRAARGDGHLPYGGTALARVPASDLRATATQALQKLRAAAPGWWAKVRAGLAKGGTWLLASRARWLTAAGVAAALLLAAALASSLAFSPTGRAERALDRGEFKTALRELENLKGAQAAFLRGRVHYRLKRGEAGILQYRSALDEDPGLGRSRPEMLDDLSEDLGTDRSKEAVELMVLAGKAATKAAVRATTDARNHRRRAAAVEVLQRLGRADEADLVAVWIADLQVKDCDVVSQAAKALGEAGDARAEAPLREIAQRKVAFFEPCEAKAAKAALAKLKGK